MTNWTHQQNSKKNFKPPNDAIWIRFLPNRSKEISNKLNCDGVFSIKENSQCPIDWLTKLFPIKKLF